MGKYVKFRVKNGRSACYLLRSSGQKIKNITNIEQTRLFFLASFFMVFVA